MTATSAEQAPQPEVTVRFFAAAAQASGTEKIRLPLQAQHESLADFLLRLPGQFPQPETGAGLGRVCEVSSFLRNGVFARPEETMLRAGDTVDVLPPFAGG